MRFGGRGRMLGWLRTGAWALEDVRHDAGKELVLRADHVALYGSPGSSDRWMTALDIPLFAWERALGGTASWSVPPSAELADADETGSRLVFRSPASESRLLLEVTAGRLAVSDSRITWTNNGPARLVVIAAADDADLHRTTDLLGRRGLAGLGRQRAQHAEQLHRGGVAMRAAGVPGLDDAVEWAKVRADALLGARLAGDLDELPDAAAAEIRLAEGLLAAGLTHLPRTYHRRAAGRDLPGWPAFERQLDAWTGESDAADVPLPMAEASPPPAEAVIERALAPASDLACGGVDAEGIASLLVGSLGSLWGVNADAVHGRVTLAPDVATLGGSAALSRLRVGRSVLDVRMRRRGEVVSLAVRKGAGPPIAVDCTIRGASVREVLIDGHAVGGARARFEARESHDIQLHLGAEPPLSSSAS